MLPPDGAGAGRAAESALASVLRLIGSDAARRVGLVGVEREAGAPSDRAARDATPRGARGHASCSGRPHSSGRAHLVDAEGPRFLRFSR